MGSLPSFAAQSTNGRDAENRPFAALMANVSVADFAAVCSSALLESPTAFRCAVKVTFHDEIKVGFPKRSHSVYGGAIVMHLF